MKEHKPTLKHRNGAAAFRAVLDAVFPWTTCVACREDLPLTNGLCAACAATLMPLEPHFDARIGCLAASAYAYQSAAREMVHRLKFSSEFDIARFLAPVMAQRLAQAGLTGALVPVPLHWMKRLTRGFNHAAALSAEVSALTGHAHMPRALRRIRYTRPQMKLTAQQRALNVRGAFRASDAVRGRDIILVDDIITTGSTIAACIEALRAAGAAKITVLTACGAVKD